MIKKYIFLILVFSLIVTGCTDIRRARANDIHARTKRANDWHNQQMSDNKALEEDRLYIKATLMWTGAIGGIIVIMGTAAGWVYYLGGWAIAKARHASFLQVPLDTDTHQYPLLIYGNGRRALNPNTGQRFLLDTVAPPHPQLTAGSQAVQIGGVIAGAGYSPDEAVTQIKLIGAK